MIISGDNWHTWPAPRKRLYRAWLSMRNRCNNSRTPDFRYYGGRGIRVCPRWDSYMRFEQDMGPHPGPGWTVDRKDTDGDYNPNNCRWATRQTQAQNRNYCTLDQGKADEIRRLYAIGWLRQVDIARIFGVSQVRVSQVLRGIGW